MTTDSTANHDGDPRDPRISAAAMTSARLLAVAVLFTLSAGCVRQRAATVESVPPPHPTTPASTLLDDLPEGSLAPLLDAIEVHARKLEQPGAKPIELAGRHVEAREYAAALHGLVDRARHFSTVAELAAEVERTFEPIEVQLDKPFLVSGYFEPEIPGARRAGGRFTQPLFRLPSDLRRGVPYLTRAEIDSGRALAGRGLELCFVDPLDAFVLQTEGGGVVLLDDGSRLALDHAGTNQRDHVRIGRFLDDKLPPGPRDWPVMEAYLRSLPERQMRDLLEKNPRYSFFRERATSSQASKDAVVGPNTAIGLPAIAGRTIATDATVVPRGGLAFLVTQLPVFDAASSEPRWKESRRFVLDEDAGGGIKGARIDFYFGTGADAGRAAGVMKQPGRIFYLVPRDAPSNK